MVSLHMKTSQIICSTTQLNGFCIMDSHYAWMDEWMNEWMNLYDEWFLNRFYIKILSIGKYCEKNLNLDTFSVKGVRANGLSFKPTKH